MLTTDGDVDPSGLRAVEQMLAGRLCGAADYRQETVSTNSLALSDLRSGAIADRHCPKLYLTDSQTAGRGRHGRSWISTAGTLTFSLVIDRSQYSESSTKLLSLAVGVGVARGLEFELAPLQAKLKWPNDVHISGGKVAGILLETTQHTAARVVVGVGMNVSESPDLSDEAAVRPIRSVAEVVGRQVHRYELLQPIVANVLGALAELSHCADELVTEFRSRCLLTGQVISFHEGTVQYQGACRGITDQGDLIVESDTGVRHLQSGEAHLVRTRGTLG
jgi:BirA family biotin operon repressor/biotin-[acetyl-CoA-carboxylase] ligase